MTGEEAQMAEQLAGEEWELAEPSDTKKIQVSLGKGTRTVRR